MTRTSMILLVALVSGCGGAAAELDEREYSDSPIVSATGGAPSEVVSTGGANVAASTGGASVVATGGSVSVSATGGASTGGAATGGAPAATGGRATGGSGTGGYQATGGAAPRTGNWTLCDKLYVCNDQRGECYGDPVPVDRTIGRGCRGTHLRCGTLQGLVVMPDDPTIIPQLVAMIYPPSANGVHFDPVYAEADRYAAVYCASQQ